MEREKGGRVKRVRASTRETQAACPRPKRRTKPPVGIHRTATEPAAVLANQEGLSEALEESDQIELSQPLPSQPLLASETDNLPGNRTAHQSHATRIRNQEENYRQIREKQVATSQRLSHRDLLDSKHRHSKSSMEQFISEETNKAACQLCGLAAQFCGEPVKHVTVTVISLLHVSKINVPVYQCSR